MKKILSIALIPFVSISMAQATVMTFDYTGATQTWVAPTGASNVTITAYGASGGDSFRGAIGGKGGIATGDLSVDVGEVLSINVGGTGLISAGGFNGGGNGGSTNSSTSRGAGGGGATDVRQGGSTLASRVIVAGGGGGAGGDRVASQGPGSGGGGGGGYYGGGGGGGYRATGGNGGTQTEGGSGGVSPHLNLGATNGIAGTLGIGGSGGAAPTNSQSGTNIGSSGGSAGLTGSSGNPNWRGGGGGGGSSYIGGVQNGSTSIATTFGAGSLQLEYFLADISGIPASGSILDLGNIGVGGTLLNGGALSIENTGEALSSLNLFGFSGFGSLFSLSSGDDFLSLIGDGNSGTGIDIESYLFSFNATGLTAGLYSTDIFLHSNAGSLSYTLQATVSAPITAVPEPATFVLLGLGFLGLGLSRRHTIKT